MQLFSILSLLAAATTGLAKNLITFRNQDDIHRTVHFTANAGLANVGPVRVEGFSEVTVTIPHAWVGNYFAVQDGQPVVPGMLGEVAFQGWEGKTYFDVSAIVNKYDVHNVKMMFPAVSEQPNSGCEVFHCNNAYYYPDDKQTKVTHETHIISTLGHLDKSAPHGKNSPPCPDGVWESGSDSGPASGPASGSSSGSDSDSDSDGEFEKRSFDTYETFEHEAVLGLWPRI